MQLSLILGDTKWGEVLPADADGVAIEAAFRRLMKAVGR
jgi:hypothetical protein